MDRQIALFERIGLSGRRDSLLISGSYGGPERTVDLCRPSTSKCFAELVQGGTTRSIFALGLGDSRSEINGQHRLQNRGRLGCSERHRRAFSGYETFFLTSHNSATMKSTFPLLQQNSQGAGDRIVAATDDGHWVARLDLFGQGAAIEAIAAGFETVPETGVMVSESPSGVTRTGLAGNQSLSHYCASTWFKCSISVVSAMATAVVFVRACVAGT